MNPGAILTDPAYASLKHTVLEHTGLAYYTDKDDDLAARLSRRLTARAWRNVADYLALFEKDPGERDCLVGELTIGETYFFRQHEHFQLLRNTIIPEILDRKRPSRTLRIWSAGCATGAEPYSIALLLALNFETALTGWDVSILGTDINVEFLAQARQARFSEWAMRETAPEIRARCFRFEGKKWVLRPEYRKWVAFRYHNLTSDQHPSENGAPFDLILCRNVLIYFSQHAMGEVAARFYRELDSGGWLLVGHAEPNAAVFSMFEVVLHPEGSAYRKNPACQTTSAGVDWSWITIAQVAAAHTPVPVDLPFVRPKAGVRNPAPIPIPELDPSLIDDIRLLADSGHWDEALRAAEEIVRLHPLDAAAQFTLGMILEHSGTDQGAREALRRAIYLDRSFVLAHYHLGASMRAEGDRAAARRSFRAVLRLAQAIEPSQPLPHGDGITAGEVIELAKMHLEMMGE